MTSYEVIGGAPLAFDAMVPMFESPDPAVSLVSPFLTVPESNVSEIRPFKVRSFAGLNVDAMDFGTTEPWRDLALRVSRFEPEAANLVTVQFMPLAGEPIEVEMDTSVADQLTEGDHVVRPELLAGKHGFLGFGKAEVVFEQDPEQEIWDADFMLPVLRLHRPKRPGCSSVLSVGSAASTAADATLEALGMGGGGGVKFTTALNSSYQAPSRCLEVCHPAKMKIVWGRTLFNGTEFSYGTRVTISEVDTDTKTDRPIPASVDACNRSSSSIESIQRLTKLVDKRQNKKGEIEDITISFERQASAKVKIGFSSGKVPITLSVDLTRSVTQSMSVKTTLEAGARYLGYSPSRRGTLELCWTTK
jgi:hypothetical protein